MSKKCKNEVAEKPKKSSVKTGLTMLGIGLAIGAAAAVALDILAKNVFVSDAWPDDEWSSDDWAEEDLDF